jgi:hypothetical protein
MANTYSLINSNILAAEASSVTFSSIPATYTDLVISISGRGIQANLTEIIVLEFNGNSSLTFSYTALRANSSTIDSVRGVSQGYGRAGYTNSGNSLSNTFGSAEIYIPSYTASRDKAISAIGMSENNSGTAGDAWIAPYALLWQDSTAITSIKISPINGPNWSVGASFYLYGISNA